MRWAIDAYERLKWAEANRPNEQDQKRLVDEQREAEYRAKVRRNLVRPIA